MNSASPRVRRPVFLARIIGHANAPVARSVVLRVRSSVRGVLASAATAALLGACGGDSSSAPKEDAAWIDLSTNNVVVQTPVDASASPTVQVTVSNAGAGQLGGLTVSSNQPWLKASLSSTVAPATITLMMNTAGMSPATYSGAVTLTSSGAVPNNPQTIVVSLALLPAATTNYTIATSANPPAGGTTTGGGTFVNGAPVTVVATPASGYSFANWTEGGTVVSTSANYTFSAATNRVLVASFLTLPSSLTVSGAGTGSGTITASPSGIVCTSAAGTVTGTCTAQYPVGTTVTLTATPASGHAFSGWSGACSGTGACSVSVTQSQSVTATFTAPVASTYSITTLSNPTAGGATSGGGTYASGSTVSVTAAAASGYVFTSWTDGGAVVSTAATYSFAAAANRALVANFAPSQNLLTVTGSGTGTGSITSSSAGVSCLSTAGTTSGTCNTLFATTATVILTATPNAGHTFVGWSGACSGTGSCSVAMTQPRTVTATFTAPVAASYVISTSANPAEGGTTTGAGTYASGAAVTVTATPSSGYAFANWTEGATIVSTNASYTFAAAANRILVANFSVSQASLTVSATGTGTGTVTSSPSGIACTSTAGTTTGTCTAQYPTTATVNLTPTPSAGNAFTGWSGACSGTSTCSVSMTQARAVTASFTPLTYSLTVSVSSATTNAFTPIQVTASWNSGSGSCIATPLNPKTCTVTFPAGSTVTLAGIATTGGWFSFGTLAWGGACSGSVSVTGGGTASLAVPPCTVIMTSNKAVSLQGP